MKLQDFFENTPTMQMPSSPTGIPSSMPAIPNMPVDEVSIDNANGIGSVPDNQNIEYKGLRVLMKPKTFLGLAASLTRPDARNVEGIKKAIQAGKAIGAPFLTVDIPESWENGDFSVPAKVSGHEGRNRMWALLELEGNDPIEVHIFPRGLRARHLIPEWIRQLKSQMIPEKQSVPVTGPLFVEGHVDEELDEVYPGQSSGKLKNYVKRKYGGELNCTKAAKVKSDPDASSFYKKRASWYQSLHCRGKKTKKTNESVMVRPCCDDCAE